MHLTYKINKPASFIFNYLTDMQKFVSVHPVISKMEPLGNNTYRVYETLKMMGFIPIPFIYRASIEGNDKDQRIVMRATIMKLTKIEINFIIKSEGEGSIVEENIHFASLFPIKMLLRKIFEKQHNLLFKNIETCKD